MTTYKSAEAVLREAIKDPTDQNKLAAAKKHPRLKNLLAHVTQEDLITLNKVAKGADIIKCTDQ